MRSIAMGLTATVAMLAVAAPAFRRTSSEHTDRARNGPGYHDHDEQETVKAGTYTITIHDKSNIHDFHLTGPGVDKKTSVPLQWPRRSGRSSSRRAPTSSCAIPTSTINARRPEGHMMAGIATPNRAGAVACSSPPSPPSRSSARSRSRASKRHPRRARRQARRRLGSGRLPGADLQNTRNVPGPIKSSNVATLKKAWSVPIRAAGTFGRMRRRRSSWRHRLHAGHHSNVYSINFKTGKVNWFKKYNSPSVGPNGVNVVGGVVYGATGDAAFALQASTGEQLWSKKLTRNVTEGIDMAPGGEQRHGLRLDGAG